MRRKTRLTKGNFIAALPNDAHNRGTLDLGKVVAPANAPVVGVTASCFIPDGLFDARFGAFGDGLEGHFYLLPPLGHDDDGGGEDGEDGGVPHSGGIL